MTEFFTKCVRCGVCCFSGPCSQGNHNSKYGWCSELIINSDKTTSCNLVLKRKVKPEDIGIRGVGCSVKNWFPGYYKEKLEIFNEIKSEILKTKNHGMYR